MDKLRISIKKIIPLNLKIILSYLKNINHNSYSLSSMLNPPKNVSDFFVFDSYCDKTVFFCC